MTQYVRAACEPGHSIYKSTRVLQPPPTVMQKLHGATDLGIIDEEYIPSLRPLQLCSGTRMTFQSRSEVFRSESESNPSKFSSPNAFTVMTSISPNIILNNNGQSLHSNYINLTPAALQARACNKQNSRKLLLPYLLPVVPLFIVACACYAGTYSTSSIYPLSSVSSDLFCFWHSFHLRHRVHT